MSTHSARHWSAIGESTFVGGLWFMYALYRVAGRTPFRLVLFPVILYYWLAQPLARRSSLEYLSRMHAIHGVPASAPGWRQGIRHFVSFAETILDKMLALSGRYRFERLRFVGREPVLDMIARGQGGIFVTAHVGCLEMIQAAAVRHVELKLNVLVHTAHAERFNRVLQRLDPSHSVRLIQVTEVNPGTAVMLADLVDRGEFVAIAADRVPTSASKVAEVDFVGARALFPVGGYVLAALLKCPLYLLACVREQGEHVVYFERLAERVVLPRAQRAEALATLAQDFATRLERLLVRAPFEWFNFFPFWGQRLPDPSAPRA